MNNHSYFQSLTLELDSLKNRIRNFISDQHWQTDGEWKESVLRTILRRHLPDSVIVGKGFVLNRKGAVSSQIDILLLDASKPVLYREGDLYIVTSDAVLGAIEVKTKLRKTDFQVALTKLADIAELIGNLASYRFIGLLSYEADEFTNEDFLSTLKMSVKGKDSRVINCVALGPSYFVRYWKFDPNNDHRGIYRWHSYKLKDIAPAYFIYNVVEHLCPSSIAYYNDLWYPDTGKEPFKIGQIARKDDQE